MDSECQSRSRPSFQWVCGRGTASCRLERFSLIPAVLCVKRSLLPHTRLLNDHKGNLKKNPSNTKKSPPCGAGLVPGSFHPVCSRGVRGIPFPYSTDVPEALPEPAAPPGRAPRFLLGSGMGTAAGLLLLCCGVLGAQRGESPQNPPAIPSTEHPVHPFPKMGL